jgi:hypothetical protein
MVVRGPTPAAVDNYPILQENVKHWEKVCEWVVNKEIINNLSYGGLQPELRDLVTT